ncbi:MAG TPA: DUF4266 domain-containing protein [Vicinamibacteria bacterium]|jgi:hypothetical protein|nr:DUF4266 domain-containing protein [Vicinamibacteria bacterium]
MSLLCRTVVLAGVMGLSAQGCATVQPWQRGRLADPCMTFDSDAGRVAYQTHWQEAREGAAGGFGVQSGGCGCK